MLNNTECLDVINWHRAEFFGPPELAPDDRAIQEISRPFGKPMAGREDEDVESRKQVHEDLVRDVELDLVYPIAG